MLARVETKDAPEYLLPFKEFVMQRDCLIFEKDGQCVASGKDSHTLDMLYDALCDTIIKGHNVLFSTRDGEYVFGKLENSEACFTDTMDVVATDLSVVERMVVIKENEIKALASLERPSIRLKINALFASTHTFSTQRVKLRLADELLVYHVCKRLFAQGIHFLFKAPKSAMNAEYRVCYDGALTPMGPLS